MSFNDTKTECKECFVNNQVVQKNSERTKQVTRLI